MVKERVAFYSPETVQHWRKLYRRWGLIARRHNRQHWVKNLRPHEAIRLVFPRWAHASAIRIANCESTAHASRAVSMRNNLGRWAVNGQYKGIFQMGEDERKKYGQYKLGDPSIKQVRSAHRYWKVRRWRPWECK